jgi:hypothetical protein
MTLSRPSPAPCGWLARGSVDVSGEPVDRLDRRILDIPAPHRSVNHRRRQHAGAGPGADRFAGRRRSGRSSKARAAEPAGALTALDLADVKPAADQPVPGSGVATASFVTFDGLTLDLRLFARDNADWLAIAASGKDAAEAEAKAINGRVAAWSYAITPDRAKLLRTRLADLVEPAKGS